MDLKQYNYLELLEKANEFVVNNDKDSLLIIKKEFENRIESKKEKGKNPSKGSLAGYYEISKIIESIYG
tara:strand:+ start:5244 stop:5450 length:207 start_codon:yes stop_codon:yes gene_type:complete